MLLRSLLSGEGARYLLGGRKRLYYGGGDDSGETRGSHDCTKLEWEG